MRENWKKVAVSEAKVFKSKTVKKSINDDIIVGEKTVPNSNTYSKLFW